MKHNDFPNSNIFFSFLYFNFINYLKKKSNKFKQKKINHQKYIKYYKNKNEQK